MRPTSDFDPAATAKKLLRESRSGALATLMPGSGDPYCSLVNVASAADGSPLLLISTLAVHTKNILSDARVSLMLDERRPGDPLEGARVMLMGAAVVTNEPAARQRYLARQPEAEMFAGFADFSFYRVVIRGAHLVAGFGRIVDLGPQDILTEVGDAAKLTAAEAETVSQLNAQYCDTIRRWGSRLVGGGDESWRCVGCDPEGLELQLDRTALRLPFPGRVRSPDELMSVIRNQLSGISNRTGAADT
jgi:putative heme iron utilization protein